MATSPSNLTALVADDHELPRLALSALLTSRLGFGRVIETETLDQAFERLGDAEPVALALFDLNMPGMNGPWSLQAVREVFPAVKVAVFSASTARADMLAALSAGAHGYVPKIMRMDEMEAAIRDVMSGRIYVPPSIAENPPPPPGGAGLAVPSLTERQREVLELIKAGRSNKEIARELKLGLGTVKIHVAGLLRGLGVATRAEAAAAAR